MVKTIFNLLIRYHDIRKLLFSSVEDKINIFVQPGPVITSTVYMYPISIYNLFANKYFQLCHWLMQKIACLW